jgi:DMSO reductase anchor subunit
MHPAQSVILFTTATGAGYGFMAVFALAILLGAPTPGPVGMFLFFAVAFALIVGGLLASTFHLGHPERAWRALTQWRSSWLSREGVFAVFFFLPGGLFALLAIFAPGALATSAGKALLVVVAFAAAATVLATGMIYAQLKAIPAWHTPLTPLGYLAFAAATGATLLSALKALAGVSWGVELLVALGALAIAGAVKAFYWLRLQRTHSISTASTATGLGSGGEVRLLDGPHTQANYLMKEMGFQIARNHAEKVRLAAMLLGFVAPTLLLYLGRMSDTLSLVFAPLAFVVMMIGVACERWLFFAEAKHVVTLFYGAQRI